MFVLISAIALIFLITRLYNLMTDKKDDYNQIVLYQQEYDSRVIPYKRGDILDRNGTYLATSQQVYNLIIDAKQIMSKPEYYLQSSVDALVESFGYDRAELMGLIEEKKDKAYVKYAKQLTYEQKQAFEAYQKEKNVELKKENPNIKISGIWFEEEYKRVYPYGSLACNILGFAKSDGSGGNGGIEQSYNSTLIGINGREYGYLNDSTNLERVFKSATDGNTVVSTIDVNIQKIVERQIAQWESETGSKGIGVVVMDPNNGEVLAMANNRQYDLNNPRDLEGKYTEQQIFDFGLNEAMADYKRKNKEAEPITLDQVPQHYTNDEIVSLGRQVAWNYLWRNFVVSDTYEPGSPSKIFTVAAAVEEGVIDGNETFECHGFLEIGGYKIRCVSRTGHGVLTVQESLMKSCNVVMMLIAQKLGEERFYKYQELFGFGVKTGIDLPGEGDTANLVYYADTAGPTDVATNSFGQSYNCTMIQMAAAYSSVINGGSYYRPHVVKQVLNSQGSVVDKMDIELVRETVSESTARFINEALWRTVNDGGTGSLAIIPGYDVAGKTGTAEKAPRNKMNYVVSFAGYAPAYDPQVLVYVVIDEPNVADQARSGYATAVCQKILEEVLPYMNIFPDLEEEELAEEEGISDIPQPKEEPWTEETPVEATTEAFDEVIVPEAGDGSEPGIPENLPQSS